MTRVTIQEFVKLRGESPEKLSKTIKRSLATIYNWMNSDNEYVVHYDARNNRIRKIELSRNQIVYPRGVHTEKDMA